MAEPARRSDRVIEELRAFPARRRGRILAALSSAERAQVLELLEGRDSAVADEAPAGERTSTLSPWLLERLRQGPAAEGARGWRMTAHAHAALIRAAAGAGEAAGAAPALAGAPSRPLLSVIGDMFSGRARA